MLISGSRYTHGALIKTFICGTFAYWHCGHQGQHTCTLTWYIQSYQILSYLFFIFSFIFFLTFLSLLLSLSNVFFSFNKSLGYWVLPVRWLHFGCSWSSRWEESPDFVSGARMGGAWRRKKVWNRKKKNPSETITELGFESLEVAAIRRAEGRKLDCGRIGFG